eukprot:TRINITY_DN61831_c0_g1_i1.p1 TRINITY_DN61831_c0_g1~~TRINITY_DN61831_c0_g1_i1.p1  ORF type:complete len:243 (+),score=51.24 TRINITY_DN61831_c0_g1_i1:170-898(+)
MDPITLHFNIFQAGSSDQGRRSLQVDDPRGKTVGSLKRQLFSDALEAQRSVRFIASGRVLEDTSLLENCNLGRESHICVSINERSSQSLPSSPQLAPKTEPVARELSGRLPEACEQQDWSLLFSRLAGFAAMVGSGVLFFCAWKRRRQMPMNMTQLICIAAAVWVYLLLFHATPIAFQVAAGALRWCLGSASAKQEMAMPTSEVAGAEALGESSDRSTVMQQEADNMPCTARARSVMGTTTL